MNAKLIKELMYCLVLTEHRKFKTVDGSQFATEGLIDTHGIV